MKKEAIVLAGDIGGTNARFGTYRVTDKGVVEVRQQTFESQDYKRFERVLEAYLNAGKSRQVAASTFAIAGPVIDQRVKATNLPWTIDAKNLGKLAKNVTLLNDLVAAGYGAMASSKLAVVYKGKPTKKGNVAIIAAGTGLGEASFIADGNGGHIACATEGSHVEFAPQDKVQDALLVSLRRDHPDHVSVERIASGSTIQRIYRFFVEEQGVRESKANASAVADAEDPNVVIVDLAIKGTSQAAMRTLDLWASVYGAEAGNLALKCLAVGGVFVCGGLSGHLAKVLAKGLPKATKKGSPFVEAFLSKGRLRSVVERIPVAVCLEPNAGLFGAASHAALAV